MYVYICMYVKSLSKWRRDVCLKGFRLKLSPLTYRQRLKKITLLTDSVLFNVVFVLIFMYPRKVLDERWQSQFARCATHKKSFAFAFFCIVDGAFACWFSQCAISFTRCTLTRIKILNVTQIFDLYHLN